MGYHAKDYQVAISEELWNRDRKNIRKKMLTRYERVTVVKRHRGKFYSFGKKGTGHTVTSLFLYFHLLLYRGALKSNSLSVLL